MADVALDAVRDAADRSRFDSDLDDIFDWLADEGVDYAETLEALEAWKEKLQEASTRAAGPRPNDKAMANLDVGTVARMFASLKDNAGR